MTAHRLRRATRPSREHVGHRGGRLALPLWTALFDSVCEVERLKLDARGGGLRRAHDALQSTCESQMHTFGGHLDTVHTQARCRGW